jgi:hypothetical protein
LWYPQAGVEKLQTWTAKKMGAGDYDDETGEPDEFKAKPWVFLTLEEQRRARWFFETFDDLNPPRPDEDFLLPRLFAFLANLQLDTDEPKSFWDDWWKALPMDNGIDDDILPTDFTELWIPASRTQDMMVVLRDHYAAKGFAATGTNACEIYAAKASPFWMSPSYQEDMLRIDLFWFRENARAPDAVFYPQFWKLLDPFEPRYHWGKFLPTEPAKLRARYPRWDDFMELRARYDPDGVFVTEYWRKKLGIV